MPEVEFSSGSSEEELADFSVPEEEVPQPEQEEEEDDSDTHTSEERTAADTSKSKAAAAAGGSNAAGRKEARRESPRGERKHEASKRPGAPAGAAEPKKRRKSEKGRELPAQGTKRDRSPLRQRRTRRREAEVPLPPGAPGAGMPLMGPMDMMGPPPLPPWASPGVPSNQPMLPMLHSVMKGKVQIITGRGALLRLSDGGPARYVDGLLQHRPGGPKLNSGDSVFVKVARLEAGLVIVDQRHVDGKTGEDLDPENEHAEVEAWVDVPNYLVGRIIGKGGAQIRQICEESGANLRFDDSAPPDKQAGADGEASGASKPARRVHGGAGSDLAKFLDEAREGAEEPQQMVTKEEEKSEPQPSGAGVGGGDGDDLRAFLEDARGGEDAEPIRFEVEDKMVEFTAADMRSWEETLHREMEAVGVTEMYMERLTIRDRRGRRIDLTKGFSEKQFPISVQYLIPADAARRFTAGQDDEEEEGSDKENVAAHGIENVMDKDGAEKSFSAKAAEEAYLKRIAEEGVEMEPRLDAITISGADKLSRKHIEEVFKAKDLPHFISFKHISKSEVICIFSTEEDAADALEEARKGFEDVPCDKGAGPGLWRACNGYLKFKQAEQVKAPLRPEAIVVEGVEGLDRRHLNEIFRTKGLPACSSIELIDDKTTAVCAFATAEDVTTVLDAVAEGFEEVSKDAGPGVFRAKHGRLSFRRATMADRDLPKQGKKQSAQSKKASAKPPAPLARLRINGDAEDVAKAQALLRQILEEQSASFPGRGDAGRLRPGEVSRRISIPADLVGRVIGKGGETIKRLEADSGARLRVLSADDQTADGEEAQELVIQGMPDAVEKAEDLVGPILENNRGKAMAKRKEARDQGAEPSAEADREAGTGAQRRRRSEEDGSSQAAQAEGRSDKVSEAPPEEAPAEEEEIDSDQERRLRKKMEEKAAARQQELTMKACKVILQKQWRVEKAASIAEELAQAATAYAEQVKEERRQRDLALAERQAAEQEADEIEEDGRGAYEGWIDDNESAMLGRAVASPCGHGRISRVVTSRAGIRYISVQCFSGMTIQAPEKSAQKWLTSLDRWMGECVLPPKPPHGGGSAAQPLPSAMRASWTQGGPHINGLAVDNLVRRGSKLAFRLLRANGMLGASVPADELQGWTRVDTRVYLIELCATPRNTKHFVPCRHDYRAAREPYEVGALVVLEGTKPGVLDIGLVRKVLIGEKGDKVAAAAVPPAVIAESPGGPITGLRRVLRRCSPEEEQRRENALKALEAAALPLLQDRLPEGVEALGVGANLDGSRLRLFVRVHGGSAAPSGADARIIPATMLEKATAAAAAALGAMLGCETEVLSERAPPKEHPPKQQPVKASEAPAAAPTEEKGGAAEGTEQVPKAVEPPGSEEKAESSAQVQEVSEADPPSEAPKGEGLIEVKDEPDEPVSKKQKKKAKKKAKKEAKAAKKAAKKMKKMLKKKKGKKGSDSDDSSSSSTSSS